MRVVEARFKRLFDVFLSACGLVLLSPILVCVAAAVALLDGLPVFYVASRVGRNGRLFRLLKFRTMAPGADAAGPRVTTAADSRVTRLGRFLRKSKLDELPQLVNVLTGEMSLVGPRPEDPRYVARYTDHQRRVFEVLPGLTSLASLTYVDEESLLSGENPEEQYLQRILPTKLSMELDYLRKQTLGSDLQIIAMTFFSVLGRRRREAAPGSSGR